RRTTAEGGHVVPLQRRSVVYRQPLHPDQVDGDADMTKFSQNAFPISSYVLDKADRAQLKAGKDAWKSFPCGAAEMHVWLAAPVEDKTYTGAVPVKVVTGSQWCMTPDNFGLQWQRFVYSPAGTSHWQEVTVAATDNQALHPSGISVAHSW